MDDLILYPPLDVPRGAHASLLDDPATDPALAAVIRDLRSRWPRIGQDADHPLADHFVRRHRGPIKMWRLLLFPVAFSIACFIAIMVDTGLLISLFFISFVFAQSLVFQIKRATERSATVDDFYHRIFKNNDPHIQLLPIHPRDLLAMHVAIAVLRYRSSGRWGRRLTVAGYVALLCVGGGWLIYERGINLSLGFMVIGISTTIFAIYSSLTSEYQAILGAIGNFGESSIQDSHASQRVGCLTSVVCLAAVFFGAGSLFSYAEVGPSAASALLFIISGILFIILARLIRRDLHVYADTVNEFYWDQFKKIPQAPLPEKGPPSRIPFADSVWLKPHP